MEVKLLVVDDEVQIRVGIEKGIRWRDLGIQNVKSASNGVEALSLIEHEHVDILITDIRMPGMDGLELARRAKEIQKEIHIIILSGFSEFEYAKQAINIGVKDYLLKPIKVKELTEIVRNVIEEIRKSRNVESSQKRQSMEKQIVQHILTGNLEKQEFLQVLEDYAGWKETDTALCVLMEPDTRDGKAEHQCKEEILNILEAEKQGHEYDFAVSLTKQVLYVVRMDISRSRAEILQKIEGVVREYNNSSRETKLTTLSAAVSENYSIGKLLDAVEECTRLLNRRLYMGTGIVTYSEKKQSDSETSFYLEDEGKIRQYIIGFQYEEVQQYIETKFREMKELEITSYDLVKGVCLTLKQLLFRYIRETGLDVETVLEKNKNFLLEVPDLFTIEQYETWICSLYYLVLKGVSEHTERTVSSTIMAAAAYISTHYHEDITVEFMSAYVNKSKNYFSYLFKKEMKMSFTEYLNRYRIEQACVLLEATLDLAGEIGQQVGFRDEKYFSSVFKKIMGCPPSLYRKNKGIQRDS